MTDITSSFLQQVSNCKKYDESGSSSSWSDNNHKSRILKSPQKKLPFVAAATDISKAIVGLQTFLKDNKTAYLDTSSRFLSSSNFLTEDEKDAIDHDAMSTIDKCKSGISSLQHSLMEYKKRRTVEGDVMAHLIGIVDILQQNLMDTVAIFKKIKKERMRKKMQEAEGYFRLDTIKKNPLSPLRRGTSSGNVITEPKSRTTSAENSKEGGSGNGLRNRSNSNENNNNNNNNNSNNNKNNNTTSISPTTSPLTGRRKRSNSANRELGARSLSSPSFPDTDSTKSGLTSPLSPLSPAPNSNNKTPPLSSPLSSSPPAAPVSPITPATSNNFLLNKSGTWVGNSGSKSDFNSSAELVASREEEESNREGEDGDDVLLESERELLEAENASLQREFDTMADQVRVIDQQLVEVSRLFDVLTEHAVIQTETMDSISDLTENAIGHTKQGVNQLQKATGRTVDFRIMVLLFLITCSVSLLFLHWYED